jgi:GNAT superfamily N-acetyltransferase
MGIVVDSNHRNRGVGTHLLNKAEDQAKELNCIGIRANSGFSRSIAHKFYLKNNYDYINDQKRFIKTL